MSTVELEAEPALGVDIVAPPVPTSGAAATEGAWLKPGIAWYAVSMVALVTVFGQLDTGIMSLLVGPIKHDTHMTDTQISLLMGAAYSAVYLCSGIPMARVSDKGRRTFILPAALAIWSLGTLLCGVAQNFWQFALFRGIIGGGVSVKGPTSVSLIPDLVPREKLARAFGIYNTAIMGGQALSFIIGGLLLGALIKRPPIHLPFIGLVHGWQMVFFLMGVPGIVIAAIFMLTVPEPARHGRKASGSVPIRQLAAFLLRGPASKVFIPIIIASAVNGIYLIGVSSWRPAFFERSYGLGPHEYGPISGLVTLITAPIGVLLGAWISEHMARRWDDAHMRLVLVIHMLAMPISIVSPLMPNFELALACQAVSGTLLMISAPAQLAAMQIITPNEMRGQVNAVYMITISVIGSGLGPTAVALLTDLVFKQEAQLKYAMVTAAMIATPIVIGCLWRAVKPYGPLHRQVIDAERA